MANRIKDKKMNTIDKEQEGLDGGGRSMKEHGGHYDAEFDPKNDLQKKQYINDGVMMGMERMLYGLVILVLFLKF